MIEHAPGHSQQYTFDRVVVRHGSVAPAPVDSFPDIARDLRLSRDVVDALPVAADQSRFPHWSRATFAHRSDAK
jgi:hypothetical protein